MPNKDESKCIICVGVSGHYFINIKDSIRQGGVLSVIEYANLMDEIAKELKSKKVRNQQVWNSNINGCLLWMDDLALFHHDMYTHGHLLEK